MQKLLNIFLVVSLLVIVSCQKEEMRVRYPESTPVISEAIIAESVITYGDSISLSVSLKDQVAPLSTLEIQIVVNGQVLHAEKVRTKGNEATVNRRYLIPFGPKMPNDEQVKVYLSAVNVEGFKKDSILSLTRAMRPVITKLYIVPTDLSIKSKELIRINAQLEEFAVAGLEYPNKFTYYVASKVNGFGRIDWSGLVFGLEGGVIVPIKQGGAPMSISDEGLVGVSIFTFDAYSFTSSFSGKLLEPVTSLDVVADLKDNPADLLKNGDEFRGATIYFGEHVEVVFSGVGDVGNYGVSPDYFEVTGANKAKFLAKTGLYKVYYHKVGDYLYIEPLPTTVYPEVLWLCGQGYGRPNTIVPTGSWNWNSPLDYAPARMVSPGKYQVTLYLTNSEDIKTPGFGTLDFKFFHYRGWDHGEELSTTYTTQPPLVARSDEGKVGNYGANAEPFAGVYRITVDTNGKTTNIEKLK